LLLVALLSFVAPAGISADTGPSSEDVLEALKKGNERFSSDKPAYPNEGAVRRTQVAPAQHPMATVVSCSDSRVPPEILFDRGIGDLFIIRVIGNIGGADQTGSAEYGVEHLETPLLVVLGHTRCGAVSATLQHAHVEGSIPQLLDHITPAVNTVRKQYPETKDAELLPHAIKANVFQSISEMMTRSAIIRERVHSGKLKVVGAVYDIQSGKVEWLGQHPSQQAFLTVAPKAHQTVNKRSH
jgi:carbonic anhydrase